MDLPPILRQAAKYVEGSHGFKSANPLIDVSVSPTAPAATVAQAERFLTHLEKERGNGISTGNARLAAMHTFARYLSSRYPERLGNFQEIFAISFKRDARLAPIEYMESKDVEALLGRIDRRTIAGQRDYALFSVMCNTGAVASQKCREFGQILEAIAGSLQAKEVSLFQIRQHCSDDKGEPDVPH